MGEAYEFIGDPIASVRRNRRRIDFTKRAYQSDHRRLRQSSTSIFG